MQPEGRPPGGMALLDLQPVRAAGAQGASVTGGDSGASHEDAKQAALSSGQADGAGVVAASKQRRGVYCRTKLIVRVGPRSCHVCCEERCHQRGGRSETATREARMAAAEAAVKEAKLAERRATWRCMGWRERRVGLATMPDVSVINSRALASRSP
jgi:hypothetical protein